MPRNYAEKGFKIMKGVVNFISIVFVLLPLSMAQADNEKTDLGMFFKEEELVVSPTRHPKQISYVAENMTVITSQEIELMNAHTLSDVLNTVNGVQVFLTGGPGSMATALIQGAEQRHVTVFIDGVTVNNLFENVAEVGAMPVQNIDRIEIIKGPASSSWGSALGGIINVITKSGHNDKKIGGLISGSYGQKNTGDYRAEVYGSAGNITYYLNGSLLNSDGFRPNNDFSGNNLYGKLSIATSSDTKIQFTVGHNQNTFGITELRSMDLGFNGKGNFFFATMSLSSMIRKEMELNLSLRTSRLKSSQNIELLSSDRTLDSAIYKDSGYGFSGQLAWQDTVHSLVLGIDYDDRKLESNKITGQDHAMRKSAVFVNDTIMLGKFTITPGIRYDSTDTNGDFVSPSIGVTYGLAPKTLIRATVARGFSIPPLSSTFGHSIFYEANPDLRVEKVMSYQAGIESAALNNTWVKASVFRHYISDAIATEQVSDYSFRAVNSEKEVRQGGEIEIRVAPVRQVTLSSSATFIDARDRKTDKLLPNIPRYSYDVAVLYNDGPLKALLKGRYIWWNADHSTGGKYDAFVFDLNMIRALSKTKGNDLDAYINIHNIFNGSQYVASVYKNPMRWIEAGLRFKF